MGKLSAGQWLCRCRDSRSALPNDVPRLTDEIILIKAPSSVICFANATFPVNGEGKGLEPPSLREVAGPGPAGGSATQSVSPRRFFPQEYDKRPAVVDCWTLFDLLLQFIEFRC